MRLRGAGRPRRLARRALFLAALVLVALLAAACASTADTPAGLRSWASSASYASNDSLLRTDLREITTGIRLGQLKATRTACDGLGYDASNAIGELPSPDHELTNELNDAYSTLVNAAQSCSTADSFSSRGFARYRSGAARGLGQLDTADRRLRSLER